MFEVSLAALMLVSTCCAKTDWSSHLPEWLQGVEDLTRPEPSVGDAILMAAKEMADRKIPYRFSFPVISYPLGEVPGRWGLCCDVVVRACRAGGIDLQQLVYEDSRLERQKYIRANRFHRFPRPLNKSWVHRRTANLNLFFERFALDLPTRFDPDRPEEWQPGDIVIYEKNGRLTWHIAIVSDRWDEALGVPYIVDAWLTPGYASEDNRLTDHGPIAGHYRITDEFRDTLSWEHRHKAKAAWRAFLQETSAWDDRIVKTRNDRGAAIPATWGNRMFPRFSGTFSR